MIAVGGGTGPSRVFGLSFKYQCLPLRTGGDEILTNCFFTREAWIFYHGLRGKGAGGLWYGGVEKSKYYGRFYSAKIPDSGYNMLRLKSRFP